MGHILLLGSVVPKSKAILAALTWITTAENLSRGQKGWVLAAKKALSVRWDGRSCQGWNHIGLVSWLPSFFLLTLGPSAVPKRDTWRNLSSSGGLSPIAYCKTTGGQRIFFFFFNSDPCLADAFTKETVEAIQVPVPLICPGAIPSPVIHCFGKWLDSSPAFTLEMQGGHGSAGLQRSYVGWECDGRVAGILSAQVG